LSSILTPPYSIAFNLAFDLAFDLDLDLDLAFDLRDFRRPNAGLAEGGDRHGCLSSAGPQDGAYSAVLPGARPE
jgi:hypothetical protein